MHALYALIAICWSAQAVLELDAREMRVGQIAKAHLTIVDATIKMAPVFPHTEGLVFRFEGQRQSTVMVNFKTTRTITLQYAVTAVQSGTWTIPSMTLELAGGERAVTSPVTVEVSERDPSGNSGDRVFATMGVDDAWVGQTLVYHLDFRTTRTLVDRRWTLPELDGFVAEQTSDATEREIPYSEDSRSWTRLEVDVPLVATAVGARTISPAALTTQYRVKRQQRRQRPTIFSSTWDLKTEVFASELVPIVVRALPEARPEDFSGLVGTFTMVAELSAHDIAVGESATLTVQVTGNGSLYGFDLPQVPQDAGYRAYDDAPYVTSVVRGGRFQAIAVAKRAIVPERTGRLELPAIQLTTFDPTAGEYVVVETAPLVLNVGGSDESSGLVNYDAAPASSAPAELADDILPIHPKARLATQAVPRSHPLAILAVLPWIGLVIVTLGTVARSGVAKVDHRKELLARAKALGPDLAAAEALFRDAVGRSLGIAHGAVDRAALDRLPEPLVADAQAIYEALDAARYGGADAGDVAERVRKLVKALMKKAQL